MTTTVPMTMTTTVLPTMPDARRTTRQRLAVADALAGREDFATAQEIHAQLRVEGDPIGLATVYRSLAALVDEERVDVLRSVDGEARYRLCDSGGHHHHLVCRECRRTVEVEGPAVEAWASSVAQAHGFVDVAHLIELFGTCPDCAKSSNA